MFSFAMLVFMHFVGSSAVLGDETNPNYTYQSRRSVIAAVKVIDPTKNSDLCKGPIRRDILRKGDGGVKGTFKFKSSCNCKMIIRDKVKSSNVSFWAELSGGWRDTEFMGRILDFDEVVTLAGGYEVTYELSWGSGQGGPLSLYLEPDCASR